MPKYCLIIFAVLFCLNIDVEAQSTFHRGYKRNFTKNNEPDTSSLNLAAIQLKKNKTYVSLDGISFGKDTTFRYLLITNYDHKGTIEWSRLVSLTDADARIEAGNVTLMEGSNDSLYFSFVVSDGKARRMLGSIDNGGRFGRIQVAEMPGDESRSYAGNLLVEGKDTLLYQITNYNDGNKDYLYFNSLTRKRQSKTSNGVIFKNKSGAETTFRLNDAINADDSTFVLAGGSIAGSGLSKAQLSVFDKTIKSKLQKTYTTTGAGTGHAVTATHVKAFDGGYLLAGNYTFQNAALNPPNYNGVFVMKLAADGKVIWSKIVDPASGNATIINGLTTNEGGGIVIGGTIKKKADAKTSPYLVGLDKEGNQQWMKTYEKAKGVTTPYGALFADADKGFGYFVSDYQDEVKGVLKTSFIKTDQIGKTTCEVADTTKLFVARTFTEDTLSASIQTALDSLSKVNAVSEVYKGFNIPQIKLEGRKFCPNDVVDHTFRAKLKEGISWKWNDDSTADTLRVFSVGTYHVTVTVGGEYCFMLCDTATLEYYEAPSIIPFVQGMVCENAPFGISTSAFVDASPATYLWNTGDKTPQIIANTLGTYTVAITDFCGQKATNSVTVTNNIYFPNPSAGIAKGERVCINTPFALIAAGAGGGGGPYTFKWSTDATTSTIQTATLGNYSVVVTDMCGKTASANITVDKEIWLDAPSVGIAKGGQVCKDTPFKLFAAGAGGGGTYNFSWSNNATGNVIESNKLGTYTVTVTDNCGLTASDAIIVTQDIWLGPPTVTLKQSETNTFCQTGTIGLEAETSGSVVAYKWSVGNSTTNEATVTGEGKYSITVTDECGLTGTANIEVGKVTASCLKFPKIVLPGAKEEENLYFGAFNQCGADSSLVGDYVLNVYNRWGQQVFTTTEVLGKWYGKTDDNKTEYPSDVYVWFVRYKVGKYCETEEKGDVTIFK